MNRIFIQTRIQGDWNIVSYSRKKVKSNKNRACHLQFFVPNDGADKKLIDRELKRGFQFFNHKEGFLFGALYELEKLGKIEKEFH